MKTIRLLFVGLAGLAAALALSAGTTSSKKTYAVVGYYSGAQPSAALMEKASHAVGERMAGLAQVQDPSEADHTVQVRFWRDSFQVYVDALPLERRPNPVVEKQSLQTWTEKGEFAREAAEGRGINN